MLKKEDILFDSGKVFIRGNNIELDNDEQVKKDMVNNFVEKKSDGQKKI